MIDPYSEQQIGDVDRSLSVIVLAGFVSMYSMRFCDAMLPEFGNMFNLSDGEAAQALSYYAIGYGLMQLFSGAIADRVGKVATVRICILGGAIGALMCAMASRFEMILLGRLITGFFSGGIIPMIIAWLGDNVPTSQRQSRLATLMSATVLGTMTGQWTGGLIVAWMGWHIAFYFLVVFFVVVAWRLSVVPSDKNHVASKATWPVLVRAHLAQVRRLFFIASARRVLLIGLVEGLLTYSAIAFIPTHLHQSFGVSAAVAGGVLAFYSLGGFAYARSAKALLRRFSSQQLLRAGTLLQFVGFFGLAVSPSWALDMGLCMLTGFGLLMVHNAIQLQATEISAQRGAGVSMFVLMVFLGQTLNAWFGGKVVDAWAANGVFYVAAIGSLLVSWMLANHLRQQSVSIP